MTTNSLAANPAVLIFADPLVARQLLGAWPLNGTADETLRPAAEPSRHPRPARTGRGQLADGLADRQDRACTHLRAALDYWRRTGDIPTPGVLRDALKIRSQLACDLVRMLRAMPGADPEPDPARA